MPETWILSREKWPTAKTQTKYTSPVQTVTSDAVIQEMFTHTPKGLISMYQKVLTLLLVSSLCSFAYSDQASEAHIMKSRTAIKSLGKTLKGELVTAMKSGGPANAIHVCNTKAPAIADTVSKAQGLNVSRTSLKNRNPNNAPTDWQVMVLEKFEADKMAGTKPGMLEYAEVVDTDTGKEFRYMKAIPTGEVCLKCHGSNIDPKVSSKLNALYPEDKAIGFYEGDLRGAFVVTEALN